MMQTERILELPRRKKRNRKHLIWQNSMDTMMHLQTEKQLSVAVQGWQDQIIRFGKEFLDEGRHTTYFIKNTRTGCSNK